MSSGLYALAFPGGVIDLSSIPSEAPSEQSFAKPLESESELSAVALPRMDIHWSP